MPGTGTQVQSEGPLVTKDFKGFKLAIFQIGPGEKNSPEKMQEAISNFFAGGNKQLMRVDYVPSTIRKAVLIAGIGQKASFERVIIFVFYYYRESETIH